MILSPENDALVKRVLDCGPWPPLRAVVLTHIQIDRLLDAARKEGREQGREEAFKQYEL